MAEGVVNSFPEGLPPQAVCEYLDKRRRTQRRTTGPAHSVPFDQPGLHQRNLYIDVPTRLGKKGCDAEPAVVLSGD